MEKSYVGFKTIVFNEVRRFMKIWPQTLLSSAITITLYFIILNSIVDYKTIKGSTISYEQYIAPGFILMAIIINSYSNVSFSFATHKFQRSIEEMFISPLPNYVILLAYTVSGVIRGLLVGVIVTCISLFFTSLSIEHPLITLVTIILTAAIFSLAGFTTAIYASQFDDVVAIPIFILTPLVYLGGVFIPYYKLSAFWQSFILYNPIYYMVSSLRYGMLGYNETNIVFSLFIICLLTIFFWCLNIFLLHKNKMLQF